MATTAVGEAVGRAATLGGAAAAAAAAAMAHAQAAEKERAEVQEAEVQEAAALHCQCLGVGRELGSTLTSMFLGELQAIEWQLLHSEQPIWQSCLDSVASRRRGAQDRFRRD